MSDESNIVHIFRCGRIPMYPTELIVKEMKDTLDD